MTFTNRFDFRSDILLNELTKEELNFVKSIQEKIFFSKGDKLFYEDGIPTGIFQLINGRVKNIKQF